MTIRPLSRSAARLGPLLVLALVGCAGGSGYERYVPAADRARTALEAALESWRNGQAPGLITADALNIHVVDSARRPGQKLADFEVLGLAAGDSPSCYAARLRLQQPAEELVARFVVLGIDPIYVLRYEDFVMMEHWCDVPDAARADVTVVK
jgi:hypothetical protein